MKAWVLHGVNDLRLEMVPDPVLTPDEVLIRVKAAGICGSDIPRIYQTGAHTYPLIPGHEFSGEVVKAGSKAGEKWLGKRVGIFPLIPCGICEPCRKSQYEMCRNYSYLGSRRDGGFAEYAAVPVENLIELPDEVSFQSAAMLEPMSVAVHALRRLAPKQSETVAVCGLGTIGLLMVMFLHESGVKNILAVGNKRSQEDTLSELGMTETAFCNSREQDAVEWLECQTDGRGVDVFFDCVGKNETLTQAVRAVSPGGRICLVGNPASDMSLEKDVYWKILRDQLTLMGSWNSCFTCCLEDDWHYVLECLIGGRIKPQKLISHRFPLEQLDRGLRIMKNKTENYIKICMTVS